MKLDNFYKLQAWVKLRNEFMKENKYLCADCLNKGKFNVAEEVHHIIPLTNSNVNDVSISLNKKNLICLCKQCHRNRHKQSIKRYEVDKGGRVIPLGD